MACERHSKSESSPFAKKGDDHKQAARFTVREETSRGGGKKNAE